MAGRLILEGVKEIIKNAEGDFVPVFETPKPVPEPEPEIPPLIKLVVPELITSSGSDSVIGNRGIRSIHDEDFMFQTPNKTDSARLAVNVKDAIVFNVKKGEKWVGDANNNERERSEMYCKGANFRNGKDAWLSFGMRIYGDFEYKLRSTSEFCYVTQVHAAEDAGDIASAPPFGLKFFGKDQLEIVTASTTEKIHTVKPKAVTRGFITINRNDWDRFVIRFQFHPTNGQLQIWQNGKEILNLDNIPFGYNDEKSPYPKGGIYRSPNDATLQVGYVNYEVGNVESLFDRVKNPLPILTR